MRVIFETVVKLHSGTQALERSCPTRTLFKRENQMEHLAMHAPLRDRNVVRCGKTESMNGRHSSTRLEVLGR